MAFIDNVARIAELYLRGNDTYTIAKLFGCSATAIGDKLKRANVSLRPPGNKNGLYAIDRDKKILELYSEGLTSRAIAKKLGVSSATISRIVNTAGVERRYKRKLLSIEQRKEAANLYQSGYN